jgi:hypothetical protein
MCACIIFLDHLVSVINNNLQCHKKITDLIKCDVMHDQGSM